MLHKRFVNPAEGDSHAGPTWTRLVAYARMAILSNAAPVPILTDIFSFIVMLSSLCVAMSLDSTW